MKKLEEMNLVDDFLAYSMLAHKIYGEEAARYILECILQRRIGHLTVVSQKTWYGEEPEKHGVRLDVYLDEDDGEIFDVEPDNNSDVDSVRALPRRTRFYHSKIDAGTLAAGEGYDALRNVVVIFIMTYDPFDLNRMVYTIKNGCVEVPGMPYEDGARSIFLYTRGEEGNPSEELRALMRYMEHSVRDNAKTPGLSRLHDMVTEVKADRKVGLAYMKMWQGEEAVRANERARTVANRILDLLERLGTVSEEERERILSERNLKILDDWYEDALAKTEAKAEAKTKAEMILLLLSDQGQVPEDLKARILSETDYSVLERWILAAKRAESLEQFAEETEACQ